MRKILSLILGLLWALPVWGACQNLYNESAVTDGYFYNADFEWIENASTYTTDFMSVAQETYVLSVNKRTNLSSPVNIRVNLFDANKVIKSQLVFSIDNGTTDLDIEISIPVDISYVRASSNPTFVTFESFLPINCVNSCRNLFDKDAEYINAYVNANSGVLTIGNSGSTTQYSFVIPVQPNTKYTLSGMSSGSSWGSFTDNSIGATATSKLAGNGTLTTGANDKYLIGLAYASGTQYDYRQTLQIEEGDVATEYVPYCKKIKIATTKYNETAFSPLNTALANAISVVDTVVSNTITQAGRIATLQAQKQTRPNDIADDSEKCPAGKKCLLVEDASGVPHWYEIVTGRLPDGYTELEYIESTGTQYIDTNVLVTDDISWEGRFLSKNDTSKAASIFGYRWTETPTAQGNMRFVFIYPDGTFAVRFGVDASRTNLILSGAETVTLKCEKDKFYANGSLFYTETRKNNEGEPQSGYLFNVNALNTVDISPVKMKLYYFKMWDDGTLVRDFVPALNPDGKIGMYDTVNGVFYENKGTGTFIGGQPVFN